MTEQTQQPEVLTVADMVDLKNIIDAASSRGAFRADEMAQIGTVYNRLAKFIDQVNAAITSNEVTDNEGEFSPSDESES